MASRSISQLRYSLCALAETASELPDVEVTLNSEPPKCRETMVEQKKVKMAPGSGSLRIHLHLMLGPKQQFLKQQYQKQNVERNRLRGGSGLRSVGGVNMGVSSLFSTMQVLPSVPVPKGEKAENDEPHPIEPVEPEGHEELRRQSSCTTDVGRSVVSELTPSGTSLPGSRESRDGKGTF